MSLAKSTQKCPYCKETIAAGASRCKHCHADLKTPKRHWLTRINNFRAGFLGGILFALVLFVLGYLHFS
jgi:uncharacterized paraquat-inducible protein A